MTDTGSSADIDLQPQALRFEALESLEDLRDEAAGPDVLRSSQTILREDGVLSLAALLSISRDDANELYKILETTRGRKNIWRAAVAKANELSILENLEFDRFGRMFTDLFRSDFFSTSSTVNRAT